MTLPRRTFGCSGEVLLTLSIFIATKSPILNLSTLPLDSFIFLLYFCCCPVMYSSVAFFLCGFSGEVPGWSVHKEDCESQWGLSPHVPEIFLLLLDLLLDLLLPSWCGLSHFFVAGVAYKVKQTMLLLLEKFQSRRFLCVSVLSLPLCAMAEWASHSTPWISLFGTTHLLSEVIIVSPFDKAQLFLVILCLVSFPRLRLFCSSGFVSSHVFVSHWKNYLQ